MRRVWCVILFVWSEEQRNSGDASPASAAFVCWVIAFHVGSFLLGLVFLIFASFQGGGSSLFLVSPAVDEARFFVCAGAFFGFVVDLEPRESRKQTGVN